jgi:hypothetical protein
MHAVSSSGLNRDVVLSHRAGHDVVGNCSITVHSITSSGIGGSKLFITDFSSPWRAQFNADFVVYLFLVMAWIIFRERKGSRGLVLAIPVLLGSLYLLPYLFVATFRAGARFDALILGNHIAQPNDP